MFLKGNLIAIIVLFLDQIHKWYMLEVVDIDSKPPIVVTDFFNLVMVWNKGISFGMGQGHEYAPLIFSVISILIVVFLYIWMKKGQSFFLVVALAIIIGGALGNVIDRVRFNAVADFFDFHIYGYHWPAFNIADSAVFIGAVMLFLDTFLESKRISNDK